MLPSSTLEGRYEEAFGGGYGMTNEFATAKPVARWSASEDSDGRWLKWSVAFLWMASGLLVVHPYYRVVGAEYLARLSMPAWVMGVACAAEVLLGLRVAFGKATGRIAALQLALVLGFTTILAWLDATLLVHPFGALTKNVPLIALIGTSWLFEREGWTARANWLLRFGMASVWITEGLFPKMLFQQPMEVAVVANSGLAQGDPAVFLRLMGVCQLVSGIAVLILQGRPLRWLLIGQVVALVVLPVLVSVQDPLLWVHPFTPLLKNVPIIAGTVVLVRRC